MLRRFYDVTWDEISQIFNYCFKDRLEICGFARGIPKNRIVTQYMDWSSHKVRKAVFETPFHNVWHAVDDYIHKAARKLHIVLIKRTFDITKGDFDNKLCGGSGSRKLSASQRKALKDKPLLEPGTTWPDIRKFNLDRVLRKNLSYELEHSEQRARSLVPPAPTLPALAASQTQLTIAEPPATPKPPLNAPVIPKAHHSPIPSLLYRAYTSRNAGINQPTIFVAGQFAQLRGNVPQPISPEHSLFQTMLQNHLNKREILGPFISLTDSLLWTVSIASRNPEDAHVAVIETKYLDHVYPISDYMHSIPLESCHRRYKGTCEYLVWGKVPGSAIRGDFSFSSLRKFAYKSLSLSSLSNGRSVVRVSTMLAAKEMPLSKKIGAKIGCLVRMMGLNLYSESILLSRAVESVVQGWSFKGPLTREAMEAFVQQMAVGEEVTDSVLSSFGQQNSLRSFQEGVDRGLLDLDGKKARSRRYSKQSVLRTRGPYKK